MLSLAHRFDNVERVRKVLAYTESDWRVLTSIEQYDTDPWLLNCENGTLDLRDGRLLAHQREHMQTKIVDIAYNARHARRYGCVLERIFRDHPDVISFLRRAVATASPDRFVNTSSGFSRFGRNGKSTFVETIRKMLGEYAQASVAETWLRQQGGRRAEPEIARLPGVRMVTTAEIGEGRVLDETRVKAIVAGDGISTRALYQATFEFTAQCNSGFRPITHRRSAGTTKALGDASASSRSLREFRWTKWTAISG